jgi:murein peptide amidase A
VRVPAAPRRRLAGALAALAIAAPAGAASEVFGHSVQGRPLHLITIGAADAPVRVLVVGVIHGNEAAGLAVAATLRSTRPIPGVRLLIVPSVNPDGRRRGTRGNANGVDLNRNFAYRWRATARGSRYHSGPRPLSEPESRAVRELILRERPTLSIWYHQPETNVRDPDASPEARRYAALVGLPFRRLAAPPGTVAEWTERKVTGAEAFVVEFPAGPVGTESAARHARAVRVLAQALASR